MAKINTPYYFIYCDCGAETLCLRLLLHKIQLNPLRLLPQSLRDGSVSQLTLFYIYILVKLIYKPDSKHSHISSHHSLFSNAVTHDFTYRAQKQCVMCSDRSFRRKHTERLLTFLWHQAPKFGPQFPAITLLCCPSKDPSPGSHGPESRWAWTYFEFHLMDSLAIKHFPIRWPFETCRTLNHSGEDWALLWQLTSVEMESLFSFVWCLFLRLYK